MSFTRASASLSRQTQPRLAWFRPSSTAATCRASVAASSNRAGLLADVEEVTCDTWGAYAEAAARDFFGAAVRVTIDRLRVTKTFRDRLTDARRELQNGLPADAKAELKGGRWLWVTNAANPTAEQRTELAALQRRFPGLAALHDHRERLRASAADGRSLGLAALEKFNRTLENWMGDVANYFVGRSSNGRAEGFNRGLRALLWRACGMTNFAHFRLRVLHAFGRKFRDARISGFGGEPAFRIVRERGLARVGRLPAANLRCGRRWPTCR